MTQLIIDKTKFKNEIEIQINKGYELGNSYDITPQNASSFTFEDVDTLNRGLKSYDSYNKELLKQSFNSIISENEYLIEYTKLINMADGWVAVQLGPPRNIPASELMKIKVVLTNIIEFLEDLSNKIELIPEAQEHQEHTIKEEYVILLLSSNPDDQSQLNFPAEFREITERVKRSKGGFKIRFEPRMAVRSTDILMALNETNPDIIHFSGHGDDKSLVIQGADGLTQDLEEHMLLSILDSLEEQLQLVLLSACKSSDLANSIINHVPYAIGMNKEIGDEDATAFAAQFYSSLAFGQTVETAFKQGKAAIRIQGLQDYDVPELYHMNRSPDNERLMNYSI